MEGEWKNGRFQKGEMRKREREEKRNDRKIKGKQRKKIGRDKERKKGRVGRIWKEGRD